MHAASLSALQARMYHLDVPNQKVFSHFHTTRSYTAGLQLFGSNGKALISFTSKFNYGLGPKGGIILATSPVHFYLKIKGTLGSINRRCISVGPRATTSNKQNYLDIQEVSWLKSWEEGKERKRKEGREGRKKEEEKYIDLVIFLQAWLLNCICLMTA